MAKRLLESFRCRTRAVQSDHDCVHVSWRALGALVGGLVRAVIQPQPGSGASGELRLDFVKGMKEKILL